MRKFLMLTRILMRTGMGGRERKVKVIEKKNKMGVVIDRQEKVKSNAALYIVLVVCMIPFMAVLFAAVHQASLALMDTGREQDLMTVLLGVTFIANFVFSISSALSIFYYNNDLSTLVAMPLKSRTIAAAKFFCALVYEYPVSLVILVPSLIAYGLTCGMGPGFWVNFVLALILVPVVPFVYGSILVMVLMRVSRSSKNRDTFTLILSIAIIVAVLAINIVSRQIGYMDSAEIAAAITNLAGTMGPIMHGIFPSLLVLEPALAAGSALYIAIFVAVVIVLFVIFLIVADFIYVRSASDMNTADSKNRELTRKEIEKGVVKKSAFAACAANEVRSLTRSTIYLFNCVIMNVIWPAFMLVIFYISFTASDADISVGELIEIILGENHTDAIGFLFFAVVAVLLSLFNFSTSTAISREGKQAFIMRYIPVPVKTQLRAKIFPGTMISIIAAIVYCAFTVAIIRPKLYVAVLGIIFCFLFVIFTNYMGLLTDLAHPKLEWDTEQQAMKNNISTIYELLFVVLWVFILFGGGILCYVMFKVPFIVIAVAEIAVLIALIFINDKSLTKKGEKFLRE